MPKRMARVGLAASDSCKQECTETAIAEGLSDECDDTCSDRTDDVFHSKITVRLNSTMAGMQTCGRGTQTRQCRAAAERDMLNDEKPQTDQPSADTVGYHSHASHVFRDRALYVNAAMIGPTTCTSPPDLFSGHASNHNHPDTGQPASALVYVVAAASAAAEPTYRVWYNEYATLEENLDHWPLHVCSDGGEGSVRVPFRIRKGGSTTLPWIGVHYDFACPYGSQDAAPAHIPA